MSDPDNDAHHSDESAPEFNQIKHLLLNNETLLESSYESIESETQLSVVKASADHTKIAKWVKNVDKINKKMQALAMHMTKEAQQNNPGAVYSLNSYAFHSR